jgi:ABC-type multidrug transport system fused ATPase/permease subunit
MFLLFVSQSKANFLARSSGLAYDIANDERLKHVRDFLYNVKAVKIQSLEGRFTRKIAECRDRQLRSLGTWLRLTFCFFASMNQMIPAITSTVAFVAYWWAGHKLTVAVVFPILALFDMMYSPAAKLSISVTRQFSVLPSYKRIMSLLTAEEHPNIPLPEPSESDHAVNFENAEFTYVSQSVEASDIIQAPTPGFVLGPLNLSIPRNKLTMIVGPIGSGKSTLLHAISGQIPPSRPGTLQVSRGSIALCEQEPWIRSASVRENIVFLSDWDEIRYQEVLKTCCLEQDLARWPAGDGTIIGEKGTNVSGGQRARISLARAVYSQADLIILDDPLAAVDAHVGARLFYDCIRQLKQTVVLGELLSSPHYSLDLEVS